MGKMLYPDTLNATPHAAIVAGSFETDGSGAPVNLVGKGFTVARNSTGKYTVTFDNKYNDMVSMVWQIEGTAPIDAEPQTDGNYDSSAGTVAVQLVADANGDGSKTDIASDLDGPRLNFVGVFTRNTKAASNP